MGHRRRDWRLPARGRKSEGRKTAEAGKGCQVQGTQSYCTPRRQPVLEGAATRPIYCLFYYSGLLGLRPEKLFQAEIIAH